VILAQLAADIPRCNCERKRLTRPPVRTTIAPPADPAAADWPRGSSKIMAKAQNRVQVILECTSCRTSGVAGVSRYVTVKNRKTTTGRLELKKYCKYERKHTLHKEIK
jgi:large subunit ribosomal protein L33